MANMALIIAGGAGNRMHHDIPKQFITVIERTVMVYTLKAFEKHYFADDLVLIYDAIRSMVSAEIIFDSIRVAGKHGNAITVVPYAETMMQIEDEKVSVGSYPRDLLKST